MAQVFKFNALTGLLDLVTDDSTLVDTDGTGSVGELALWTDANTIAGSALLTFIAGLLNVAGKVAIGNATNAVDTLTVARESGQVVLSVDTTNSRVIVRDFYPQGDNTYDLGSAALRFARAFFGGVVKTTSQFESSVATGTAPLVVASTTKVDNLNADLLDGLDSTAFALAAAALTGSGSAGRVALWSGASALASDAELLYDSTTNTLTITGELDVIRSLVGGSQSIVLSNTDNTSLASHARLYVSVGGTSAGDPFAVFLVNGGQAWSVGVDNSDGDKFKICRSATLGTNDYLVVDAGVVTAGVSHSAPTLVSTVVTGTAPLTVSSTTKVTNLNADTVDGLDSTAFQGIDADLTALAALAATAGMLSRTGAAAFAVRTLTGTAPILVANGTGASADPTFSFEPGDGYGLMLMGG